jgi:hypothetical protein
MTMFTGSCPFFLIVMIGRWLRNSFLRYIGKQVQEFNHDVLRKMFTHIKLIFSKPDI